MGESAEDSSRAVPWELVWRIAAAFVLVLGSGLLLWRIDARADTGLPVGGHDFIAYWSAYDIAAGGGNPYDEHELRASQLDQHPRYEAEAQRYWNPPWALVVMAPVLELPFDLASSVWLVVTVVTAVLVAMMSWRVFVPDDARPLPPLLIGVSLLFVPLVECVKLGQMGAFIAAVVLGGLLALREGNERWAGVLLGLTVVKPQAALGLLFVVGIHLVAAQRWTVIRAAVATVVAVVGSSVVVLPSVWKGWDLSEASPTHWHSGTLAGWLRALLDGDGGAPTWPLIAVPLLAMAAAVPWALRHRQALDWPAIPALLAVSILAAPYAWIADAVLLVPVQVVVVAAVVRRERGARLLALLLAGVQVAAVAVRSIPGTGQQHQIVLPLGLLLVGVLWYRLRQSQDAVRSLPPVVTVGSR